MLQSENGQGLVEYVLICVLVAIVVLSAVALFGPVIEEALNKIADKL
jgi:Flp pilus assembly pilin Flp